MGTSCRHNGMCNFGNQLLVTALGHALGSHVAARVLALVGLGGMKAGSCVRVALCVASGFVVRVGSFFGSGFFGSGLLGTRSRGREVDVVLDPEALSQGVLLLLQFGQSLLHLGNAVLGRAFVVSAAAVSFVHRRGDDLSGCGVDFLDSGRAVGSRGCVHGVGVCKHGASTAEGHCLHLDQFHHQSLELVRILQALSLSLVFAQLGLVVSSFEEVL
mmetsp:Transcript_12253/g.17447  ORF Transcript_12253/g.17447 Transcript_12253/m.17447 type:complete len:216 (+) Transcript_12253:341-988(+)